MTRLQNIFKQNKHISRLATQGILTAEDFLSLAAVEDCVEGLVDLLQIDRREFEDLCQQARAHVDSKFLEELSAHSPVEYPLGAVLPSQTGFTEKLEIRNERQDSPSGELDDNTNGSKIENGN